MSNKYNVLWIDDQHEFLSALHKTAKDFGIELFPFKSMNGGVKELEKNISQFDAVLLDAKFFENEDDEPGSEDTKWVHMTKDKIRDLDKSLSYFVLTGQANTYASPEFNNAFPNVFEKGRDKDEDKLFQMLVEACQNRELTKLKIKYPAPFAVCTEPYLGSKHFNRLLELILNIENPQDIKVAQDMLNPIRKIIEAIFAMLNEIGIIPDPIFHGDGWINGCRTFLANRHNEFKIEEGLIPPIISENFYRLLKITQDGSHNEGHNLGVDAYMANCKNNYLYLSVVYLLLDILDWTKRFLDENPDKDKNLLKWNAKENTYKANLNHSFMLGTVSSIKENGWGTFKPFNGEKTIGIPPTLVQANRLKEQETIEVLPMPSPDGTKTFIKEIKK